MAISGVSTIGGGDFSLTGLPQALLSIYAKQLLYEAMGAMRFEEFAVVREDFSKQSGETLILTKYADISGSPALTENVRIVPKSMSASTVTMTVSEYGSAISVTEKLLQLSWDDQLSNAAYQLGRHYAKWGPDKLLRDMVLNGGNLDGSASPLTPSVLYGGGKASRTAVTSADVFDTDLIREAVEQLQTNNAPKFNNDFYVCVLHPHQARHIKQDPDWVAAHNYHQTRSLFNGEIGRWEDVIFIQTTHMPNGVPTSATDISYVDSADTPGSNDLKSGVDGNLANIYQAAMFGDSYYAYGVALPVEMRDNGVTDFGREHSLAWYSIYGAGLLYEDYGFRLETA